MKSFPIKNAGETSLSNEMEALLAGLARNVSLNALCNGLQAVPSGYWKNPDFVMRIHAIVCSALIEDNFELPRFALGPLDENNPTFDEIFAEDPSAYISFFCKELFHDPNFVIQSCKLLDTTPGGKIILQQLLKWILPNEIFVIPYPGNNIRLEHIEFFAKLYLSLSKENQKYMRKCWYTENQTFEEEVKKQLSSPFFRKIFPGENPTSNFNDVTIFTGNSSPNITFFSSRQREDISISVMNLNPMNVFDPNNFLYLIKNPLVLRDFFNQENIQNFINQNFPSINITHGATLETGEQALRLLGTLLKDKNVKNVFGFSGELKENLLLEIHKQLEKLTPTLENPTSSKSYK